MTTRDEGLFLHPEMWVTFCWMAQVPAMDQLTMDDLYARSLWPETAGLYVRPVREVQPPSRYL